VADVAADGPCAAVRADVLIIVVGRCRVSLLALRRVWVLVLEERGFEFVDPFVFCFECRFEIGDAFLEVLDEGHELDLRCFVWVHLLDQ
jgi:hypothetical protein